MSNFEVNSNWLHSVLSSGAKLGGQQLKLIPDPDLRVGTRQRNADESIR